MATRRLRLAQWSFFVATLVATLSACRADAQSPTVLRGLMDNDHTHDHSHSLDAEGGATFGWHRITQYTFNTDEPARMISFCTSKPSVRAMVFTILPINSTANEQLESATRDAKTMATAFDSSQVTRRDIAKGTVVQVSGGGVNATTTMPRVLYRARLGVSPSSQSLNTPRCIDAVLNVSSTGLFVLFAEHAQANVSVSIVDSLQREVAYTSCTTGCDDHAVDTTPSSAASSAPSATNWLSPVLASIVIALVSLFGVLILSLGKKHVDVVVDYMMSFGAGCLLAVTVFHMYPEGSAYVSDMGEWVAGACVLGGIAISMAFEQTLHLLLDSFGAHACQRSGNTQDEHGHIHTNGDEGDHDKLPQKNDFDLLESLTVRTSQHVSVLLQSLSTPTRTPRRPLMFAPPMQSMQSIAVLGPNDRDSDTTERPSQGILTWRQKYISSLRSVAPIAWITALGDFFHAFTDGVVLAVAFKSCSTSLGWAVALGIVLHEVPHRVGDFFIFLKAGMLVSQALAVNFVASLASLLAVVIVLAAGSVSDHTLGIMLSIGAGALLFIALVKLLPPMLEVRQGGRSFVHFLCFAVGCIVIGLSMLQHAHCDAAGGAGRDRDTAHAH